MRQCALQPLRLEKRKTRLMGGRKGGGAGEQDRQMPCGLRDGMSAEVCLTSTATQQCRRQEHRALHRHNRANELSLLDKEAFTLLLGFRESASRCSPTKKQAGLDREPLIGCTLHLFLDPARSERHPRTPAKRCRLIAWWQEHARS
jgi:hypothetical protein